MSIKIGEVDVFKQAIETEFRLFVLEQVMDIVLQKLPIVGPAVSPDQLKEIRRNAVELLRKKYPSSGIELVNEDL